MKIRLRGLASLHAIAITVASFLAFSPSARAQYFTGTVATATGGAGRAAVDPHEAGILNPAALAHIVNYFGSMHYFIADDPRHGASEQYGIVLADGGLDKIAPGSFSYLHRRVRDTDGTKAVEQDFQVAIAGFLADKLSLGVSGHYLTHERKGGDNYYQANMTAGLLFVPTSYLGLAAVAYDVLPGKDSVPPGIRTIPTYALGLHGLYKELLRVRLDFVRPGQFNPGGRTNIMAGVESFFRSDFAFRLGYSWKETENRTLLTTGLGYRGPKLSFDYAYETDTRIANVSRHLFDLWMPF